MAVWAALPVGKALAFGSLQRQSGAFGIFNAKAGAVGIPEIELFQVAVQVSLANRMKHTEDAALEDSEVAFNGV